MSLSRALMSSLAFASSLFVLAPSLLVAQFVSGTVSPNPAPLGSTVTLTITNGTGQTITLPSSCTYASVRSGSPTGPVVDAPFCLTVLTPVAPCASRSQAWAPPAGLAAGTYVFQVNWFDANFVALQSTFFCFSYAPAGSPTLTAQSAAARGQNLVLSIAAPGFGGGVYAAAASFTTDVGFASTPALFCCLDLDVLFWLSFPSPDPLLFSNFQGPLDAAGSASGLTLGIPNLPALQCLPVHLQAIVAPPGGVSLAFTNVVNLSIL